jgi:hypothetical protein
MNLRHLIPLVVAAVFLSVPHIRKQIPEDIARTAPAAVNCKALPLCIGAIGAVVVRDGSLD